MARRTALAEFLRAHRARLRPADVGLAAGGRRRTPGLRREEVAQLSGVSTTWYTWLEQGRDVTASAQVLDRVALALRLTEDERRYLFALAAGQPEPPTSDRRPTALAPAEALILRALRHCPTIVSDRRCDVVGWNAAAAAVFLDFAAVPEAERNLVWLLFSRKELRALAVSWEDLVAGFVATFRAYYGQHIDDPWYGDFVARMGRAHPEFLRFWHHHAVRAAPDVAIEFRHARAGRMLFDLTSLQAQGGRDLRFSIYTPSPGSDTEAKLRRLVHAQFTEPG